MRAHVTSATGCELAKEKTTVCYLMDFKILTSSFLDREIKVRFKVYLLIEKVCEKIF